MKKLSNKVKFPIRLCQLVVLVMTVILMIDGLIASHSVVLMSGSVVDVFQTISTPFGVMYDGFIASFGKFGLIVDVLLTVVSIVSSIHFLIQFSSQKSRKTSKTKQHKTYKNHAA